MSYFLKNGSTWRVATKESMDLHEALPAGNYTVKQDPFENLYLEHIADFEVPAKLYGNTTKHTDRIMNTFWDRTSPTGVLMTGEKGSGKTMLTKNICIEMAKQGVPTVVVNQPFHGEKFNTLLQSIEQPCVILFDEFEKVYDRDTQEHMLTLLDGIYSTKKLFMLTCNDKWRIDSHMRNRPGRIFYYLNFTGLDADFIREYCEDNLNDKTQIDRIINIAGVFSAFNFDMLKALVEDMNRYNEQPQEVLRLLNVRAEFDGGTAYTVEIFRGDETADRVNPQIWTGTPLAGDSDLDFSFHIKDPNHAERMHQAQEKVASLSEALAELDITGNIGKDVESEKEYGWLEVDLSGNDLIKMDSKNGRYIFEKEGITVILNRQKTQTFNFDAF